MTTVAGQYSQGNCSASWPGYGANNLSGDSGPATSATLDYPMAVAVDRQGNLFIADSYNLAIRRVDAQTQVITTVAGVSSQIGVPVDLALDGAGDIFFTQTNSLYAASVFSAPYVSELKPDGTILNIAGTGTPDFFGDGGPAALAALDTPSGLALDAAGNLYIFDSGVGRVRKVNSVGQGGLPLSPQPVAPALSGVAFNPAVTNQGQSTTLSFTIANPNQSVALQGVSLSITLPDGLVEGNTSLASCTGPVPAYVTFVYPSTINVSDAAIEGNGRCVFNVTVGAKDQGSYTVTTSAVSTGNTASGNPASADLTVNAAIYTVSGTVTFGGQPLSGVTMSGLPGNPVTDSSGNYSAVIGNGMVDVGTPALAGYTFTPPNVVTPSAPASNLVQNFTAVYTPPQVSTATTLGALSSSISSGGNVVSEGKFGVTARGVCWSKTVNPSTANSCTNDGTGAGAFVSTITGLMLNTPYHVRAYATSPAGTAYGADMQFTTSAPVGPFAYITGLGDNSLSVIDTATNTVSSTLAIAGGPRGVAVNSAARTIYVVQENSWVYLTAPPTATSIDAKTNGIAGTFNLFGISPVNAASNPDGTKIYVTDTNSGAVSVIDTKSGAVSYIDTGNYTFGLAVHPDGTRLYLTSESADAVVVVDLSSNTVTGTIDVGAFPRDVAINAAGTRAYVPNADDNTVSVIDVATGSPTINTVLKVINVGNGPRGAAVNQNGTRLYVTNQDDNTVSVIDTTNDSDTVIGTIQVGNGPYGIAMHPDGIHLYVVQRIDNSVSIVDATNDRDAVTSTISVGQTPYQLGPFFWPRQAAPVIGTQPSNQTVAAGSTATFSVTATGVQPLAYVWQYLSVGGSTWTPFAAGTGLTTSTMTTFATTPRYSGLQLRVVVTDANGLTAFSNAANLKVSPAITGQPANQTVAAGSTATFSVTASGVQPLAYVWQYLTVGGSTWTPFAAGTGLTTSTMTTFATTPRYSGLQLRVEVTDANGLTAISNAANLTVGPAIAGQPSNQTVAAGSTATFSVTATGAQPLTYAWQYLSVGGSTWMPFAAGTGLTSATMTTFATTPRYSGLQLRVVVTDANGLTAISNAANLTVGPAITGQPSNQTVAAGSTATFSVTATGAQPLTYSWQYLSVGGSTWMLFAAGTGLSTPTMTTFATTPRYSGLQLRVVVTDGNALSITSSPATLGVN